MNYDPQQFFRDSAWNDEHCPPATEDAIAAREAALGVRFPDLLRALLKLHDGGYTEAMYFTDDRGQEKWMPDGRLLGLEDIESVDYFYAQADWDTLAENYFHDTLTEPQRRKLIVFARHAWNQFYCLDYRDAASAEPPVVELDLDDCVIHTHAPNLAAFLARLSPEEPS